VLKNENLFRGTSLKLFLTLLFVFQFSIFNFQLSTVNCQLSTFAQNTYIPAFQRNQNTIVYADNNTLSLAWVGGMNSMAFFAFDLNLDGSDDLVAFEKNGNRILPFLANDGQWSYTPDYTRFFPNLHDWVIFKDYDNDGKKDIFTYGLAGIRVFKNDSQEQLHFTLVSEQLTSFYYTDYSNIYASPDDNLVVADVDHDGDIDILNFWVLGKYVHFQRNYARENNLANGWLDFRLEDECWGKFSEGADNNDITLLSYCQNKSDEPTRHVGSTMTMIDFNNDNLDDLILGDIDFAQVILLTNGGTQQEALMVAQTKDFPNAINPVSLYSMPLVSPVDLNKDGQNELLVSPADPSLVKSQNFNSVWLYEYDSIVQHYTLNSTSFLQEDMIDFGSGCYPVFFDWNGDGLLDLFAGNYGYYDSSAYLNGFLSSHFSSSIAYFENTGTLSEPAFRLITTDFLNLRQLNKQALYPALGDLDGDGQVEMICGCADGSLVFVKNQQVLLNFLDIDVGNYSSPQLFDLDQDGKLDLLIGNQKGQIAYYKNTTTNNIINFQLETSCLGDVDVRDYDFSYFGYATPCFFRQNGVTKLICGNEQGKLYFYDNIDNNLEGSFSMQSQILPEMTEEEPKGIYEGCRVGVAVGMLNDDQYPDMMVGNFAGGMAYFEGIPEIPVSIGQVHETADLHCYPNPTSAIIHVETQHERNTQVQLFDITGRKIMEDKFNGHHIQLNISHLSPSIYLLKVSDAGKTSILKIAKK
jgi:hypothetical protein